MCHRRTTRLGVVSSTARAIYEIRPSSAFSTSPRRFTVVVVPETTASPPRARLPRIRSAHKRTGTCPRPGRFEFSTSFPFYRPDLVTKTVVPWPETVHSRPRARPVFVTDMARTTVVSKMSRQRYRVFAYSFPVARVRRIISAEFVGISVQHGTPLPVRYLFDGAANTGNAINDGTLSPQSWRASFSHPPGFFFNVTQTRQV